MDTRMMKCRKNRNAKQINKGIECLHCVEIDKRRIVEKRYPKM